MAKTSLRGRLEASEPAAVTANVYIEMAEKALADGRTWDIQIGDEDSTDKEA